MLLKHIKFKRGTTEQVSSYTPLVGEPVLDTDTNRLYIGDGTIGGIELGRWIPGTNLPKIEKDDDFTSIVNTMVAVDTTSNTVDITMPAFHDTGDQIRIVDQRGTFDTNNVTVGCAPGDRINGVIDDTFTMDVENGTYVIYYGSTEFMDDSWFIFEAPGYNWYEYGVEGPWVIKSGDGTINAAAGSCWLVNTLADVVTFDLPDTPKLGQRIRLEDYLSNFGTNSTTITTDGLITINGLLDDFILDDDDVIVTLTYNINPDNTHGWFVTYGRDNPGRNAVIGAAGSGGVGYFYDLTDTPDDYVSKGNQIVKVDNGEAGIEFDTVENVLVAPTPGGLGLPAGDDYLLTANLAGSVDWYDPTLLGGGIGGNPKQASHLDTIGDPFLATKHDAIYVDCSSGLSYIKLPASPTYGDLVRVLDALGSSSIFNIIVQRNSELIDGLPTDYVIDITSAVFDFAYYGATTGWMALYQNDASASSTGPTADNLPLVKGSVDPTKLIRFEVDGNTSGTTRVYTVPNRNMTMAGTDDISTHSNYTNVHGVSHIAGLADIDTHSNKEGNVHGVSISNHIASEEQIDLHSTYTNYVHGVGAGDAVAGTDYVDDTMSTHVSDTSTHGVTEVAGIADITTHKNLTTNVHGCTGGADVASEVYVATSIDTHASDTTSHGVSVGVIASTTDITNSGQGMQAIGNYTLTSGVTSSTFNHTGRVIVYYFYSSGTSGGTPIIDFYFDGVSKHNVTQTIGSSWVSESFAYTQTVSGNYNVKITGNLVATQTCKVLIIELGYTP